MNSDIVQHLCQLVNEKYVIALISTCHAFYDAVTCIHLQHALPLHLSLNSRYESTRRYLCLFKSRADLESFHTCQRLKLSIPMTRAHVQLTSSLKHLHIHFSSTFTNRQYEIIGECALHTFKLTSENVHTYDVQWSEQNCFRLFFEEVNNIFYLRLPITLRRFMIHSSGKVNMQDSKHVALEYVDLPYVKIFTWIPTLKYVKLFTVDKFIGNPSTELKTLVIVNEFPDVQFPDQLKKLVVPCYVHNDQIPLPSKLRCLKLKRYSSSTPLPNTIEKLCVGSLPEYLPSQLKHLTCPNLHTSFDIPKGLISIKTGDGYRINETCENYDHLQVLKQCEDFWLSSCGSNIPKCIKKLDIDLKIQGNYIHLTHLRIDALRHPLQGLPNLRVLKMNKHENANISYPATLRSLIIRKIKTTLECPESLKYLCIKRKFYYDYLLNIPLRLRKLKLCEQKELSNHIILPETLRIFIMPNYEMRRFILPSRIRVLKLLSIHKRELKKLTYLKTCKIKYICN